MKQNSCAGFTIVELVVVILLISVLAGLVTLGAIWGKNKAQASSCLSSIKQLGLAGELYIQDYDGVFPLLIQEPLSANNPILSSDLTWRDGQLPYLKSEVRCPKHAFANGSPVQYHWGFGINHEINYRERIDVMGGFEVIFTPKSFNEVSQPSTTIFFGDCSHSYITINSSIEREGQVIPSSSVLTASDLVTVTDNANHTSRHSSGANYAMIDGSSTWINEKNIVEKAGSKYRFNFP
ncbi:MAG: type II secretion system protein [Armatimonadetes bacterium]|nr:type II secretion system protein [Armatimonadota bacterium]